MPDESDADQIDRLIQWHTPVVHHADEPAAADPESPETDIDTVEESGDPDD